METKANYMMAVRKNTEAALEYNEEAFHSTLVNIDKFTVALANLPISQLESKGDAPRKSLGTSIRSPRRGPG